MWQVYILLCTDGSFYTGITNNLEKRFKNHATGKGGAYTRSHKPVRIVYKESMADKSSVLKRENEIKKLSKKEKETLFYPKTVV